MYNGKELNEDFGLNWLDYGARWYDPSIGRFNTVDRFAEKYSMATPYHYTLNNPILFVDINGDSLAYNNLQSEQIVANARQNDPYFDKQVGLLENSDVTYSFNFLGNVDYRDAAKNGESLSGSTTTDGDKVLINFVTIENSQNDGKLSGLYHETEHGVQFEHGELGFATSGKDGAWIPAKESYDITDEINGFKAGWKAPGANQTAKDNFEGKDLSGQMKYVGRKSDEYRNLRKEGQQALKRGQNPAKSYPSVPGEQRTIKRSNVFFKTGKKRTQ